MKILLFGATGMVGQGVLREALLAPDVDAVLAVGRRATGQQHEKLRELTVEDLYDLGPVEEELRGYDACLFCLGVSAAGLSEADYRRVTYDLTLSVAGTLARLNPGMTFVYVSGTGTGGRAMWARVKGETEAALQELPFRRCFLFRPAFIQPMHGIRSRTPLYSALYSVLGPLYPVLKRVLPGSVTTTEKVGRAMLQALRQGAQAPVVENADINALAGGAE